MARKQSPVLPYTRDLRRVQERAKISQGPNREEGYEHAENQQVENIVPPPESQLYAAMCGAPFIPISLFWMTYTARSGISPWSAIIGSVPFGFGFVLVFVTCYEYLMDSYAIYAASALASELHSIFDSGRDDACFFAVVLESGCRVDAGNAGRVECIDGAGAICAL